MIKVLSNRLSWSLKEEICRIIGEPPVEMEISNFSDGEIKVQILESIRGFDIFIIASTPPPAENWMELFLLIDAVKRASARTITVIIPYFGYARQDRKDAPRVPISAKVMANLIQTLGATRVVTLDLHSEQIQGFFDIPTDNLSSFPIFKEYFGRLSPEEYVIVSPDVGGSKRARKLAQKLGNLPLAIIDKRRPKPNMAEAVYVIGEVKDKKAIIFDDIIDTGGTIKTAVEALVERGCKEIVVSATHGLFSGKAKERLSKLPIKEIIITNTIPLNEDKKPERTKILTVANLLAEAIKRIYSNMSISALFK